MLSFAIEKQFYFFYDPYHNHSPKICHSVHELFLAKLALRGRSELPRHHQYAHARRVQGQVIAKLLDSIDANLILILGICKDRTEMPSNHRASSPP